MKNEAAEANSSTILPDTVKVPGQQNSPTPILFPERGKINQTSSIKTIYYQAFHYMWINISVHFKYLSSTSLAAKILEGRMLLSK